MAALALLQKVKEGTITSSPSPIPCAFEERKSAEVQESTQTTCGTFKKPAISFSNNATSFPMPIQPDCMTRVTASISSCVKLGLPNGR